MNLRSYTKVLAPPGKCFVALKISVEVKIKNEHGIFFLQIVVNNLYFFAKFIILEKNIKCKLCYNVGTSYFIYLLLLFFFV